MSRPTSSRLFLAAVIVVACSDTHITSPIVTDSGTTASLSQLIAQEPFSGDGPLSASWTAFDVSAVRDGSMLRGNSNDNNLAYWSADTFSPDQYSQIVLGANSQEVGVAVRVSGTAMANTSAYWLEYHSATELGLHKYVGGTITTNLALRTGLSLVVGDIIRLEITATALRIKVNGVQLGAAVSDADIATGAAGLLTGQPNVFQADNWEGGNVLPDGPSAFGQEPFTGTGALSANWRAFDTPAVRENNTVRGDDHDNNLAYWIAGPSFSPNQYSQIVLGANPSEVGVAVRVSGTAMANVSAYWLEYHNATELGLHKYVGGVITANLALRTGLSLVAGDVMRLEVSGDTLRTKLNGTQLGAHVLDAAIATGAAGFLVGNPTPHQADNWEGGDLGVGNVPGIPPDSLPQGFYAESNLVSDATRYPGFLFVRDVVAVLFEASAPVTARQTAIASVEGVVVGGYRLNQDGFYLVKLPSDASNDRLFNSIAGLRQQPGVLFAAPDFVLLGAQMHQKPQDGPGWQKSNWHLNVDSAFIMSSSRNNWGWEAIAAPMAWGCSVGDASTRIAVVDGGLHDIPDLHDNIAIKVEADLPGDTTQHGTAVASIIAARGDNGTGITGIMWRASLQLRSTTISLAGGGIQLVHGKQVNPLIKVLQAIVHAAHAEARVINLSLGRDTAATGSLLKTTTSDSIVRIVDSLFAFAMGGTLGKDPLIVIAAGNNPGQDPYWSIFPTFKDSLPNRVIVVAGAGTTAGSLAPGSSTGPLVDVAAPGQRIWSLRQAGGDTATGTSYAAAFVSGLAGLLFAFDSTLTASEVKQLIIQGAIAGGDSAGGHPVVNAYESLRLAAARPGAPLCGNRIWGRGAGSAGRLIVQRGTAAESVAVGARVYDPWVYHGGRQMEFLAGLEDPPVGPTIGFHVQCRALFYNGATRAWTLSAPYCDSESEPTGPPPTFTGTYSGAVLSVQGWSHDADSVVTVGQCGQDCYAVLLNGVQFGLSTITRPVPETGETRWEIAYSPLGDRVLVALSTQESRSYPNVSPPISTLSRTSADVYEVLIPSGTIRQLPNWHQDGQGIWFIGMSEDGRTVVAGIGESPFPEYVGTACTLQYRRPDGSPLQPAVPPLSTPDACTQQSFGAVRRPGSFGNVRARP